MFKSVLRRVGGSALRAPAVKGAVPRRLFTSSPAVKESVRSLPRDLGLAAVLALSSSALLYATSDGQAQAKRKAPEQQQDKEVKTRQWHYYSGPKSADDLEDLKLFSGTANPELSQQIAQYLGIELGASDVRQYADGEIAIKINDNIRGQNVFIIQPVCNPVNDQLMQLLLLISTMKRASAKSITAVIPYYGYARQDRKMCSRIPISAADVAVMLETMGVDRVIAVDLHAAQIQGFFPPHIPVDNLVSHLIGASFFAEKPLIKPVVVSPDAGGVARAKAFGEVLSRRGHKHTEMAMLIEQRTRDEGGRMVDDGSVKHLELVGDVDGSDVIIAEDIIDSGYTICRAAEELKRQGARNIYVFSAHGIFSGTASQKIHESPIDEVIVTNTIPLSEVTRKNPKIRQLSLAPLLAEAIFRVNTNKSVTSLFSIENKGDEE